MNYKHGLNGEENSWPEWVEAERSNPTHVTWEIPGVYWLIVLRVNFARWSHLLFPSFPLSGSLQGRKNTERICVISSLPCRSPLQPSSSEFLWQMSLPESQLGTFCPKRRKSQYSQACDCGHLLKVQGSISCTETDPFLGIKNSCHIL